MQSLLTSSDTVQATEEPYLEEFIVGPISETGNMTYRPFTEGSTRTGSIKQRNYDADADEVYAFVQENCEVGPRR